MPIAPASPPLLLVLPGIAGPALAALCLALVNLRFVPRPRPRPGPGVQPLLRISALVPARDEEASIGACIAALLAEPIDELIVCDDGSADGTAGVVEAWALRDPRVRLLRSGPLSPGWAGKPHACAALAAAARGEAFLFVDADVRVEPGAVAALVAAARAAGAQVVTALPRQETKGFAEKLVVPLLHLVYYALAPLWLVPRTRDPRVCAANGQLIFATRDALARFGGHAHPSVRGAVVEDQRFCRAAKEAGLRVLFADGWLLARCRMYASAAEVRAGFVKNLYLGIGATPARLVFVVALIGWTFLLPLAALLAAAPQVRLAGALGTAALVALRTALAIRFGKPPVPAVLLHPLAILALVAIAIESALRAHAHALVWRGRRYGVSP